MNSIRQVLRTITRKDSPLNVLSFCTHEPYESALAHTGHNFFAWRTSQTRDWNFACRQLPSNYTLLEKRDDSCNVPAWVDIDVIISHNKFGQIQLAQQLSQKLGVPIISVEHTLPMPNWSKQQIEYLKTLRGKENLFITEYNRDSWLWQENECEVIPHGIDADLYKPDPSVKRQSYLLAMANDYKNREWCLGYSIWEKVTQGLPHRVRGNTPGLSTGTNSVEEVVFELSSATIYFNSTTYSPIPMAVLEAMSCGCAIISMATCALPEIIEHGVNGYLSNDPKELREYCEELLANPEKAMEMGQNARQTIIDKFSLNSFVNRWNLVIDRATK